VARRLVLARDRFGNTALSYHAGPRLFVFSSSRAALLGLGLTDGSIDELFLARVLVAWPSPEGGRSAHAGISRLPPAHVLTVTPTGLTSRRYWSPEEVPEQRLADRRDYISGFREVFDRAVATRTAEAATIGSTLSGGLDSGSVTATAAGLLAAEGRNLLAFTSVPRFDTTPYTRSGFGDELDLAGRTAAAAPNVTLVPIRGERWTPIEAMRRGLTIHREPAHSAASLYWLLDLVAAAAERGCEVLLTGQFGNGGFSWTGDPLSQPLAHQVRRLGWQRVLKAHLRRRLPPPVDVAISRRRIDPDWYRSSAIHPDFVRRLDLLARRLDDPNERTAPTPRHERIAILKPGRSSAGATWADLGSAFGLSVRDPTGDPRVIEFTLSVPDRVFIDPDTGLDRWLAREAMKGRLPDEVRLNRRRGLQAADLVPRLRATAPEVDGCLRELAAGPAASYVDVPYMDQVWRSVQRDDTPTALRQAVTILTRGIMAGLFVNTEGA
jgi:asparagine synthase (glutamine-hydrolysing)